MQALMDDCDNDGEDNSKQRHDILDPDNGVNSNARFLLRKSNLFFLLRSGNQFQPTKIKSGCVSSKDVLSNLAQSLLRKMISGHNTHILGIYPNNAINIEDAEDAKRIVALAKRYRYGNWSNKGSLLFSSS